MININIILLGKLKEKYLQEAESEYLKRLSIFAKVTLYELREESFDEKDQPELIKKKEAEKILDVLEKIKDNFVIVLDEHGKQFSSTEFSEQLTKFSEQAQNITLVIGGPLGLGDSILKRANLKLSLSKMTFTHQMVRVFLLEQIYRAMMIKMGRRYHY